MSEPSSAVRPHLESTQCSLRKLATIRSIAEQSAYPWEPCSRFPGLVSAQIPEPRSRLMGTRRHSAAAQPGVQNRRFGTVGRLCFKRRSQLASEERLALVLGTEGDGSLQHHRKLRLHRAYSYGARGRQSQRSSSKRRCLLGTEQSSKSPLLRDAGGAHNQIQPLKKWPPANTRERPIKSLKE